MIAYVGNVRVLEKVIVEQRARPLVDDEGRPSPYLRLLRQHSEVLNTLAAQFGFTPVARTRLGMPAGAGEPDEPTTNLHLRRLQLVEPDGKVRSGGRQDDQ
jgi:phage terminase small subunit